MPSLPIKPSATNEGVELEQDVTGVGEHQSLTGHTVKGIAWITAGRLFKAPLNLLAIAVLSRLLTPPDFGVVAIGMLVVTLSNVLVDGSFGMVLIQRRQLNPHLIGASLVLSCGLALILGLAVVLGAPLLERQFDFIELREVLLFLAAILPINAITTVTSALMQRAFQFGALALNAFISQLAYTIVAISLAFAGFGLWSLIWAQLVQFITDASLGYLAVRARYQFRLSFSAIADVLKSGGMFTLSKILNWAANNIDNVLIGRFLGASELGFYSRAYSLMVSARQLSGTGPIRVLFSSFAKMQEDQERLTKAYLRSLSVTTVAATLVSAFVVINSEVIVRILLGPRWLPTVPVLQIMFSAFVARTGYIVAEAVPLSLGLAGQSALRQGAQLLLIMTGAAIGAQFGLITAVIGIAAAYWIFYLLCLLLVQQLIPVGWLQVIRLHLNGILLMLVPAGLTMASRLVFPGNGILVELVPAIVFGTTSLVVLLSAPASLVGPDIVRARTYSWSRFSSYLPSPRAGS